MKTNLEKLPLAPNLVSADDLAKAGKGFGRDVYYLDLKKSEGGHDAYRLKLGSFVKVMKNLFKVLGLEKGFVSFVAKRKGLKGKVTLISTASEEAKASLEKTSKAASSYPSTPKNTPASTSFFSLEKVKKLTPEEIRKLKPDELGELIDLYERELTQEQIDAMALDLEDPFEFFEEQKSGENLCALHALHNALGKTEPSEEVFKKFVVDYLKKTVEMELPFSDIDTDPVVLADFLMEHVCHLVEKQRIWEILAQKQKGKEAALKEFLGDSDWFLVGVNQTFKVPRKKSGTYSLTEGHFAAMRKDQEGNWWLIDSRNPSKIPLPLTFLHENCLIIRPVFKN